MKNKQEGNQYDKIVKENIESIIPALMNSLLGFNVKDSVVIKEKLQQTKEKEADALRIITDPSGNRFILHLEFQVDDYMKMAYRMAEYWILLKSKHDLPVRQFVIYIGGKEPKMRNVLAEDGNYFQFQFVNITQFSYSRFLASNNPEEVILAVLGDFGRNEPKTALAEIISKLERTTADQRAFKKHLRQLRVLSRLRKLQLNFDDMLVNMFEKVDIENDIFVLKSKRDIVNNMLREGGLSVELIAKLVNIDIDVVLELQKKLSAID